MAEKKAAARKPATTKKAPAKRTAAKKMAVGETYMCDVCGVQMRVDEACDCVPSCDIICCDQPMRRQPAARR